MKDPIVILYDKIIEIIGNPLDVKNALENRESINNEKEYTAGAYQRYFCKKYLYDNL